MFLILNKSNIAVKCCASFEFKGDHSKTNRLYFLPL